MNEEQVEQAAESEARLDTRRVMFLDGRLAFEADIYMGMSEFTQKLMKEYPNFDSLDLSGLTFQAADFKGKGIYNCTMDHVAFFNCNFHRASIVGCRLSNVSWDGGIPAFIAEDNHMRNMRVDGDISAFPHGQFIHAGVIDGGYHAWAYQWEKQYLAIKAGCRQFAFSRAVDYWTNSSYRPEMVAACHYFKAVAERRGWIVDPIPNDVRYAIHDRQ